MVSDANTVMSALADYITRHLRVPFVWGMNDCALFAARWVHIKTGVDPLEGMPKWSGEKEARRIMRDVGGVEAWIDGRFQRVDPNLAKDGDIALVNGVVVIFSGGYLYGPGEGGLKAISRMEAQCSWSV
jgi:hypothetical protein